MAHLPFHKTLNQFDFVFQPSLDERHVGMSGKCSRPNGWMRHKISWSSVRARWGKPI
ncbi:MAG: hypothetical protein ACYCOU_05530 [Sulfobacillus sp.]